MNSSEPSIKGWKGWKMVFAILGIIFIVFSLVILNWNGFMTLIGSGESESTLRVYELNGSNVPQGIIISLTEEDFKEFPQLASTIRDKNQKPTRIFDDGTRFYMIPFTYIERHRFIGRFRSNFNGYENSRFFEYKGKYYSYDYPQIS
jgi:hypothetical protein